MPVLPKAQKVFKTSESRSKSSRTKKSKSSSSKTEGEEGIIVKNKSKKSSRSLGRKSKKTQRREKKKSRTLPSVQEEEVVFTRSNSSRISFAEDDDEMMERDGLMRSSASPSMQDCDSLMRTSTLEPPAVANEEEVDGFFDEIELTTKSQADHLKDAVLHKSVHQLKTTATTIWYKKRSLVMFAVLLSMLLLLLVIVVVLVLTMRPGGKDESGTLIVEESALETEEDYSTEPTLRPIRRNLREIIGVPREYFSED